MSIINILYDRIIGSHHTPSQSTYPQGNVTLFDDSQDWLDTGDWITDGNRIAQVYKPPCISPYYAEEILGIQRVYVIGNGWSDYWLPQDCIPFYGGASC